MMRGWVKVVGAAAGVGVGLLSWAMGWASLLESPAAPTTPAGRWGVRPPTGEVVTLRPASTSPLGRIFRGGVGTLPSSAALTTFFPAGPARGPELRRCGERGGPTSPGAPQLSSSREDRGFTLM